MPPKIPVPTSQVSSPMHGSQAQLALLFGTHPMPGQQLSPSSPPSKPPVGSVHARAAEGQVHALASQDGALGVQIVPQAPQFSGSVVVSRHSPAQHALPLGHAAPVPPQTHIPPTQLSPSAQERPTSPQLRGSVDSDRHPQDIPSCKHISPARHWSNCPHMQRAAIPPVGIEQALARPGSQAKPQPLQLPNAVSLRPSIPNGEAVETQLEPQQRCDAEHSGRHIEGGRESAIPLSAGPPAQTPATQICPAAQACPQRPQFRASDWVLTHIPSQQVGANPMQAGSHVAPLPAHPTAKSPHDSPHETRAKDKTTFFIDDPSNACSIAPAASASEAAPAGSTLEEKSGRPKSTRARACGISLHTKDK